MVFLVPNLKNKQDQLSTLLENVTRDEKVDLSDYELRIVTHHADLIEKIQINSLIIMIMTVKLKLLNC